MYFTELGGHSGCRVILYETEKNSAFVRKISGDKQYNTRLIAQAQKQEEFQNGLIKAPKVLSKGYTDDGLFYFDMEYIHGKTLAEYMNTIEIGRMRTLVETILGQIVSRRQNSGETDESIFLQKIESLDNQLKNMNNSVVDSALDILKKHSWKKYVKTRCHGDLTLENIIVKNDQLYFIDFLDSFYDCWIMDISTLMQDVQVMWSYRNQGEMDINTVIRLIVFRDILLDEVKAMIGEEYIEIYYALLLKLIRIYPYTKDKETLDFLEKKTASLIRIIRDIKEEN